MLHDAEDWEINVIRIIHVAYRTYYIKLKYHQHKNSLGIDCENKIL